MTLSTTPAPAHVGRFRWVIAGLLFLDTILNYTDFQALAVLAPRIKEDLGMTDVDYGKITMAFQVAYMTMFLVGGFIVDRLGARWSMALALGWWSAAQLLHAFADSAEHLMILRFLFGLAYPGAYLCAAKVVSEWFPARERGLVTGIYTAGATIGATLAPPLVGGMHEVFQSWRPPFLLFGIAGFFYVILWLLLYNPPSKSRLLTPSERDYILSGQDPDTQLGITIPTREILRNRYFWLVSLGRMIGDTPWAFYISWMPLFLDHKFGMSTAEYAKIGWIPFLFADLGSFTGGWLSGHLIKRGWPMLRARLTIMFFCACITLLTFVMGFINSTALIIAIMSLLTFSTMAWMVNLSTIPNDVFPERAIGKVVGMTTTAAVAGQFLLTLLISYLFQTERFLALFIAMSLTAPLAFLVIMLVKPREPERA